jgi:hypothetical protein
VKRSRVFLRSTYSSQAVFDKERYVVDTERSSLSLAAGSVPGRECGVGGGAIRVSARPSCLRNPFHCLIIYSKESRLTKASSGFDDLESSVYEEVEEIV